jgi:hypothetical protein
MSDLLFVGDYQHLIDKHWDDTLDGDRTNDTDVETFLEPFIKTERLKQLS